MIDQKTLAYINLYGVLGTLENLCELAPEAGSILTNKKPISIGFDVKGGPKATITFANGKCRMEQGCTKCDVKLPFSSCEKFNGLIDGTTTPIPSKGLIHVKFLLNDFTKLTDLLTKYMRPDPADLEDPDFFRISTLLLLNTITVAIAQIGNNDEIGKHSAKYMVDGEISISIKDCTSTTVRVKDHRLLGIKKPSESPRAIMEFSSIELARALFDGKVNAVACVGEGKIRVGGMISQVDNVNRILDRVALYLA
jgi:hypothetical protein